MGKFEVTNRVEASVKLALEVAETEWLLWFIVG